MRRPRFVFFFKPSTSGYAFLRHCMSFVVSDRLLSNESTRADLRSIAPFLFLTLSSSLHIPARPNWDMTIAIGLHSLCIRNATAPVAKHPDCSVLLH
jgi:hypothetical protein